MTTEEEMTEVYLSAVNAGDCQQPPKVRREGGIHSVTSLQKEPT
jgi:hypothetical protein